MAKVKFGLKNIHLFKLTETISDEGVVSMSYGAAVAFPGAVNLSISKESSDTTPFYADDSVWFTPAVAPTGYSGTLEMALLTDSVRTAFMNYIKDAKDTVVELGSAPTVYFGMTCEFQTDTGLIKKVWYKCSFGSPDDGGATTEDTTTPSTVSIPITVVPTTKQFTYVDAALVERTTPVISAYATEESDATVYANWHSTPHLPDFEVES